jgi:hypothetical protein
MMAIRKPINGVIKILVKINVLTALVALVSFMAIRERQSARTASRPDPGNELSRL